MKKLLTGLALLAAFGSATAKNTLPKCDAHRVRINPDVVAPRVVPAVAPAPAAAPAAVPKATEKSEVAAPAAVETEPLLEIAVTVTKAHPPAPPAKASRSKPGTKQVAAAIAPVREHQTLSDYMFAEELP